MTCPIFKVAVVAVCVGLMIVPLNVMAAISYHEASNHLLPKISRQWSGGALLDLKNRFFLQNSASLVGRYICPTCD